MKAALYLRVSTDGQSVDSQLAELLAECKRRGWTPAEYSDAAISGVRTNRPALELLMADVRAGRIKAVLAFKLDRLGRSLAHLVSLMDEMERHNCALVIPGQGIDTSKDNPVSRMQRQMLGVICEFERSLIRDRVKAGMQRAKSLGHLDNRKLRGKAKGMDSKIRRAYAVVEQDPMISVEGLAREIGVSKGTAWKLRKEALLQ